MEMMPDKSANLCSGKESQIDYIARIISNVLGIKLEYKNLKLTLGPNKKLMKNP